MDPSAYSGAPLGKCFCFLLCGRSFDNIVSMPPQSEVMRDWVDEEVEELYEQ